MMESIYQVCLGWYIIYIVLFCGITGLSIWLDKGRSKRSLYKWAIYFVFVGLLYLVIMPGFWLVGVGKPAIVNDFTGTEDAIWNISMASIMTILFSIPLMVIVMVLLIPWMCMCGGADIVFGSTNCRIGMKEYAG